MEANHNYCASCSVHYCVNHDKTAPKGCPTAQKSFDDNKSKYEDMDKLIEEVSCGYARDFSNTRLEETMKFAANCGFKKIGLAFCIALENEARIIEKVLRYNGFETESVICKVGSITPEDIGLNCNTSPIVCNPIGQAMLLNEAKTDLNLIIGLCIGHDILFTKHSEAPVTTFVAKDRVMAHNPMGVIYAGDYFMKERLYPNIPIWKQIHPDEE